jgi:hypothetical protein
MSAIPDSSASRSYVRTPISGCSSRFEALAGDEQSNWRRILVRLRGGNQPRVALWLGCRNVDAGREDKKGAALASAPLASSARSPVSGLLRRPAPTAGQGALAGEAPWPLCALCGESLHSLQAAPWATPWKSDLENRGWLWPGALELPGLPACCLPAIIRARRSPLEVVVLGWSAGLRQHLG